MLFDNDEHEQHVNLHEEPPEQHPAQTMVEFFKRDTYKQRQVREERAWCKHLRSMLTAYLRCCRITSEWGNPACWNDNHFRQAQCHCPESMKRTRVLDIVDKDSQ
ncbi:hypothetical protein DFH28DRAFT_915244 [Melampsora americana]|nr:hypothetical protein DFH28DRAFT_915244 [Melampsora americana]